MTFSQVIGQDDAEQQLMELIHEDRVPHAMLLCGPEGCGQLAVALAFACELLRLGHTRGHAGPAGTSRPALYLPYSKTARYEHRSPAGKR